MSKSGITTDSFSDTPRSGAAAKNVDKVSLCLDFREIDTMTKFDAETIKGKSSQHDMTVFFFTKPLVHLLSCVVCVK